MITVGRGEVVIVRVFIYEEGSYFFWEFVIDNYDIGFGVYFEWIDFLNIVVSVYVSEFSDDDEDEEGRIMGLYSVVVGLYVGKSGSGLDVS